MDNNADKGVEVLRLKIASPSMVFTDVRGDSSLRIKMIRHWLAQNRQLLHLGNLDVIEAEFYRRGQIQVTDITWDHVRDARVLDWMLSEVCISLGISNECASPS